MVADKSSADAGPAREGPDLDPREREAVIDALSEHFAADRLSVEEFERRLDRAHRAEHKSDLDSLLADLSEGHRPEGVSASSPGPSEAGVSEGGPEPGPLVPGSRRAPAPPLEEIRERATDLCVWGGRSRSGSWTPARRHRAVAIQGGIELDYREARLGSGSYELRVAAVMGGVEVVVPPDLRVETQGSAVLGSFEHEASASEGPGPLLRIRGFALMGSVEVYVREPGEPLEEGGSR